MKKLIFITIAFISVQAFAQNRERGGKKDRAEQMQDLSAEDIATLDAKKMTLNLDLSEAQQTKVQSVLLEEATFRKEKMKEREASRAEADAQRPSKEEHFKMQNEKLDRQIELKQKMKSILNDVQYAKWEAQLSEKRSNRKERRGSKSERK